MTRNMKAEIAHNYAAAPLEQKSPKGAGGAAVEGATESPTVPATLSSAQARAPPPRMLRFPDVMTATGLSRTTIWRRIRAGTFPAPLSLGENSVGWPEPAIAAWLESRPVVHYAPKAAVA